MTLRRARRGMAAAGMAAAGMGVMAVTVATVLTGTMPGSAAMAQAPPAITAQTQPGVATPLRAASESSPASAATQNAAGTVSPASDRRFALTLRLPASYRSWKLEAAGSQTTLTQIYVPFAASVGIGAHADLVISGGMGLSSLEPEGGPSMSLDGPTDVIAQAFLRAAGNRLLLHAGVNLPTGVRSLDADQLSIAQALAHPILAFRLKQYGQGADVNAGLAVALPLASGVTFGAGAGWISRGAYPVSDGSADFEPSAETALSSGLEVGREDGTGPAVRLDAVYRLYNTDRQGGLDLLDPGDQTEFQLAARTGGEGARAELTGRLVRKADDEFYDALAAGGSPETQAVKPGSYSRVTIAGSVPLHRRLRAGINAEWSGFTGGDLPGVNGSGYGAGPQLRLELGHGGAFTLGGTYLVGTLDAPESGSETDLTGIAVFGTMVWRIQP